MFWNSFKVAIRNLLRRKVFTFINSFSLSVGLASCIIILLFVIHQYSYDRFFDGSENIYRIVERQISPGGTDVNSHVPYSFVGILTDNYPEVENATAISGPYSNQLVSFTKEEDHKVNLLESNVMLADSNFFRVFSFQMIQGNRYTALKNPHSVVLTEKTALRFFNTTNVVGKSIIVSGRNSVVTGVCEDPPSNSHFNFSYLVSSTSVRWFSQDQFNLRYAKCYVKLHTDSRSEILESKFPEMVDTYMAGEIERINNTSWEEFKSSGNDYQYFLKSLKSIHLDPEIEGGMKAGTNPIVLKILILVATLIFIIACINFINLSTARSVERAREVGIRKVMGSLKIQLVFQFLLESLIISFISVLVASMINTSLLPVFNSLFDVDIVFPVTLQNISLLLLTVVFVGLSAGLYPSFILSNYKPIETLKGRMNQAPKRVGLKNMLTGFQFWISILLIICTLIFQKQIHFLHNKDLGFDKDQLLVIKGTFHMNAAFTEPFMEEAKTIVGVKGIAGSLWAMGFNGTWSDEYIAQNSSTVHSMQRVPIGDDLAEVMDFELIDGAFFSDRSNDERSVLLNEAAVDAFGMDNPVGEHIHMLTHDVGEMKKTMFKIKGVVKNFNYQSLRNVVEPLVLQSNETVHRRVSYILVKLDGHQVHQTISLLEDKWKELIPDRAFNYNFMDEVLDAKYKNEKNLANVFSLFTGLSILVAFIGLLALSTYVISLRAKEIGIRKVVGASAKDILLLLSKDFLKIVFIAFLLAIPIGWYAMDQWLSNFAYKIPISLDIFLLSGALTILVAMLTIFSQTLSAALANPIDALKES